MQTKKGLGGLRLLEENMTRRKGGRFLVILGRMLGWGCGKLCGNGVI